MISRSRAPNVKAPNSRIKRNLMQPNFQNASTVKVMDTRSATLVALVLRSKGRKINHSANVATLQPQDDQSVQQQPQQSVVFQPSPPSVAQFPQSMGQTNFTGNHSVELSCCEQERLCHRLWRHLVHLQPLLSIASFVLFTLVVRPSMHGYHPSSS